MRNLSYSFARVDSRPEFFLIPGEPAEGCAGGTRFRSSFIMWTPALYPTILFIIESSALYSSLQSPWTPRLIASFMD